MTIKKPTVCLTIAGKKSTYLCFDHFNIEMMKLDDLITYKMEGPITYTFCRECGRGQFITCPHCEKDFLPEKSND